MVRLSVNGGRRYGVETRYASKALPVGRATALAAVATRAASCAIIQVNGGRSREKGRKGRATREVRLRRSVL